MTRTERILQERLDRATLKVAGLRLICENQRKIIEQLRKET